MTVPLDAPADVAVVGAGPVGLTVAVLLGRAGHRVVVLDRFEQPYGRPRAVHFDDEAARVLQSAGVLAALLPHTEPVGLYEWRNAAGQVLLSFDRGQRGPSGWPEGTMFSQPDLERVLAERLAALPSVQLHRGAEVATVTQDDTGATLFLAAGERLAARWVVGADGAGSTIRSALGTPVVDAGSSDNWLIADVRTDWTCQPPNWQLCDPARPTTLVSSGPGRRRWEFLQLPGEELAGRAWELLEPWGVSPRNASLERSTVYRFAARSAEQWRQGRLLLAGDAAHEMPPFIGQGLCAGLRDAAAVAWRLDLVLRGLADPRLLDSYGPERLAHVRTFIDFAVELGKVICVTDPQEAATRDAAMTAGGLQPPGSSVLDVPLGPGLWRCEDALAGHLGPQGVLRLGGRTALADDLLGRGPLLLSAVAEPELADGLRAIAGRALHVRPEVDVEGTYRAWLAGAGCEAALLRPDGYVFGTGRHQDAPALVEDLLGHLAS